jgi:hypothetical protein
MEPAGVVPAPDVVEDGPVQPGPVVDELPLGGGEEALRDGVIPAFPLPGNGQDYAVSPGQGREVLTGVLDTRGRNHARRRAARRERHRQGVLDELGTHVIAQRPADHAAAGQIDHRRQVGPDLPGHDVRNIVGIAFVRAHAGREVPLDQVPGPFRGRVRDRRGPPPLLAAFQAHSGHQPSDSPLPTAAVAAQGPVDPRCLSP